VTGPLLLAVLASVGAGALLVGPAAPALPDRPVGSASPTASARSSRPSVVVVGAGAGLLVMVGRGLEGRQLALLVVVAAGALGVLRVVDASRQERRAQQRRQQVVDYCEALAGELRAGQPVQRAVDRSVEVWPEAEAVAAAGRLGASVPKALRRLAKRPGAGALRRLAGAWEISASTGSGLVVAVEQVLATARAEEATARLVRAELASAQATARLVTTLPLVVLVAAQGAGARPWHFLLDTAPGVACLAVGVALSLAGLAWIDRIGATAADEGR